MMIIYAMANNYWLIPEMTIKLRKSERVNGKLPVIDYISTRRELFCQGVGNFS